MLGISLCAPWDAEGWTSHTAVDMRWTVNLRGQVRRYPSASQRDVSGFHACADQGAWPTGAEVKGGSWCLQLTVILSLKWEACETSHPKSDTEQPPPRSLPSGAGCEGQRWVTTAVTAATWRDGEKGKPHRHPAMAPEFSVLMQLNDLIQCTGHYLSFWKFLKYSLQYSSSKLWVRKLRQK